jgi:hypothetical protein
MGVKSEELRQKTKSELSTATEMTFMRRTAKYAQTAKETKTRTIKTIC